MNFTFDITVQYLVVISTRDDHLILILSVQQTKGQATLCVQSAQYRTRSSEITFLRTVLVWLSTCIPYQLNIVSDYAITQYRTNASEIAHLVRVVCSGLNTLSRNDLQKTKSTRISTVSAKNKAELTPKKHVENAMSKHITVQTMDCLARVPCLKMPL